MNVFTQAFIAGESSPLPSEVSALIQLMVKGQACELTAPLAFPECQQVGTWIWEPGVARAPASPCSLPSRTVHAAVGPGLWGAGVGVLALAAGAQAWQARALSPGPVRRGMPGL